MKRLAPQTEINTLVETLGGINISKREFAAKRLYELAPASITVVLRLLADENNRAYKSNRRENWERIANVTAILAMAIWFDSKGQWFMGTLLLVLGSFNIKRYTDANKSRPLRTRLVNWVMHLDDLRAIGPLAEALTYPNGHLHGLVCPILTRLLPRLTAVDSGLLSTLQRSALYRELAADNVVTNMDLAIAIIHALEHIADEKAVTAVERIAVNLRLYPRLRQTAIDCLPAIRRRAELARAASTLLRPAEAPADDRLLRPASGPGNTDEALLLRPVGGDE